MFPAKDVALRLVGKEEVEEILAEVLVCSGGGAAALFDGRSRVVIARDGVAPESVRVRGPVTNETLSRLVEDDSRSVADLTHAGRTIGALCVAASAELSAIAEVVGAALGVALELRGAREDLRIARAEAAAASSLVEDAPIACAFVDATLRVVSANSLFADLVERALSECVGKTFSDLDAPEAGHLEVLLQRMLERRGKSIAVEVSGPGALLQRRSWLATVYALSFGEGAAVLFQDRTLSAREQARVRLLADAARALRGERVDVASLFVPALADWAVLDLLEGGTLRHASSAHRVPEKAPQALLLPLPDLGHVKPRGVALVLRTLRPDALSDDDVTFSIAADPALAQCVRALGAGPQLVLPLVSEHAIGALTLGRGLGGRSFTQLEIRTAQELADGATHALVRARAIEASSTIRDLFEDFRDLLAREIQNPLTTIAGRVFSLARLVPSEAEPHLAAIRVAADRMSDAVERLAAAALPASPGDRAPFSCDAAEIVEQVLARQARLLARVELSSSIDRLVVRADGERLAGVFEPILVHAAGQTPAGGLMFVRIEREGDRAAFSVSHTGSGLAIELARHVFDGLWLGEEQPRSLTLARATIESLGGRAWIETAPESGAAYCFTVPLA